MLDQASLLLILSCRSVGDWSYSVFDSPSSPYRFQPFLHVPYLSLGLEPPTNIYLDPRLHTPKPFYSNCQLGSGRVSGCTREGSGKGKEEEGKNGTEGGGVADVWCDSSLRDPHASAA